MSVVKAIGRTPMVEIDKLNEYRDRVRILAKLEGANPCGSVKDRPAAKMIEMAIKSGEFTKDKIVLEATSGNTGIGLGMVCAALGFRLLLCMPECVSLERRSALQALGAEIILTPPDQSTDGAIRKAHELLKQGGLVRFSSRILSAAFLRLPFAARRSRIFRGNRESHSSEIMRQSRPPKPFQLENPT